jgi:hypothetical protein
MRILEWVVDWGQPGTVPLVGIEGEGSASAGVGGEANAAIGLRGGVFEFSANASTTWGVGLGGKVKVMLDGWTGEADQDAIIEILRYSATSGEALLVVHWAGGYNDVMWGLDGWQDAEARALLGVG